MKNKNPFGLSSTNGIEDFYRREREQALMLKRALGPASVLQEQMDARKSPLKQFAELQNSGVLSAVEQARKLHADQFQSINQLMAPNQFSAIRETALALSKQNDSLTNQLKLLAQSFDTGILATAKAMQEQKGVLSAAMAATQWQSQWKILAEQFSPNVSAIRTIAERAMFLDVAMLRATANNHIQTVSTQWVAEQAIEAQNIVEALAQAETADESARLFIAFVSIISAIFSHFKENTVEELRSAGLVSVLVFALAIMALPQLQPEASMSEDERAAYSELQSSVDALHDDLGKILEAENALDESFISDLPRGEILRRASIRHKPERTGQRLAILDGGVPIAIVEKEGRWFRIVYRDPLANQLTQGWVYGTLVVPLNESELD
ncbi:MAG: hypothetical protein COA41_00410 [Sphingopyxis sp.]|nr:MAG: hypothetical protein COA41_00410 [Sphingopyxis sp.]